MSLDLIMSEIGESLSESSEAKLRDTINWIDSRIEDYVGLLISIVKVHTKKQSEIEKAEDLVKKSLTVFFLYDFYHETKDKIYLNGAWVCENELYKELKPKDKIDLIGIREHIMPFFYVERRIWDRVQRGIPVSNDEVSEFWFMKASDPLFYARIISIFTNGKDYSSPLHVYTQLLDGVLDVKEYEKDLEKNLPNILYIMLKQTGIEMPTTTKDAIEKAKKLGIAKSIKEESDKIYLRTSDYDFRGCEFLHKSIRNQYNTLRGLL